MSIRNCFSGKIAAGQISTAAGQRILTTLDEVLRERHGKHAALLAAAIAKNEARRKADLYYSQTIAQANVLRAFNSYTGAVGELQAAGQAPPFLRRGTQTPLGFALRSLLTHDPFEIATWGNVRALTLQLRGEAHRVLAEAIELLRPKGFGFKPEKIRERDLVRQAYGAAPEDPQSAAVWKAWQQTNGKLVDDFNAVSHDGLHKVENYFPNPDFDSAKVKALGEEPFKALVRENVDRSKMIDFATGEPMHAGKFERLLDDAWRGIAGFGEDIPTAGPGGRPMLANARRTPRLFQWKDDNAWFKIAEKVGMHSSPYEAMMSHIESMSRDVALMRVLGANPDATMRFAGELLRREPARLQVAAKGDSPAELAAATRTNRAIERRVRIEARILENLYAEVTGANRIPVDMGLAQGMADVRNALSAAQLGSAMISSITDPATMALAARFNGLPVMSVVRRAVTMMGEKGAEVFAAQTGLVMDALAHAAGAADKASGEVIRTGAIAKIANANIRASGLRRWTAILRAAFGMEMMAHVARNREVKFGALELRFKDALARYGINEADWDVIRAAEPFEPRSNAIFIRPVDVADPARAEKLSRLVTTEMDYAVIDQDPLTRSLLLGSSQPGTVGGEVRRATGMYRNFPATFAMMHFARAAARGWDGRRLSHAALTLVAMTTMGAIAMQAKEILAGRDPLSLDPREANGVRGWGKAVLQGGGLGIFGDLMFVDQTKYGNTWAATIAGPVAGSVEAVLGDFLIKNVQLAAKGQQTQWAGDALYIGARHLPGSSLWFARLAFQREVLDQMALMIDPRSRERFARIEEKARKEYDQRYWWRPGRQEPTRPPELAAIGGR